MPQIEYYSEFDLATSVAEHRSREDRKTRYVFKNKLGFALSLIKPPNQYKPLWMFGRSGWKVFRDESASFSKLHSYEKTPQYSLGGSPFTARG